MKKQIKLYDIYPKIVRSNQKTMIYIKPIYSHVQFNEGEEYEIVYYPMERKSTRGEYQYQLPQLARVQDGLLCFEQYFFGEQEHMFVINDLDEKMEPLRIRIYSLEEDLFTRLPLKGDMHLHSYYSDGQEAPAYVAARCREIGYDFMAVTDHHQYAPSIEAQQVFADVPVDLLICRGEEIHLPDNPVHMVNFGGTYSVNALAEKHPEQYFSEVQEKTKQLTGIRDKDARFQCASSQWAFDHIRQAGGLGLFCHPYWDVWTGYYVSESVQQYMFHQRPFDALELIGGYFPHEEESNILQVARYYESRAKGEDMPVVGVSDAHGCDTGSLFGWFYTIVFAPSTQLDDLITSVKQCFSVAVEAQPHAHLRTHGRFRLVKYAQYLMREVFPLHDQLCATEGAQMLAALAGDANAKQHLIAMQGQVLKLYRHLWAAE